MGGSSSLTKSMLSSIDGRDNKDGIFLMCVLFHDNPQALPWRDGAIEVCLRWNEIYIIYRYLMVTSLLPLPRAGERSDLAQIKVEMSIEFCH